MKYIITGHKGQIGLALKEALDELDKECVLAIDQRDGEDTAYINEDCMKADIFFHLADYCKINKIIKKPEI